MTDPFAAMGVASFGPVTLDPSAADYGCIRQTPKTGWSGTPVVPRLASRFTCRSGSTRMSMRPRWPSIGGAMAWTQRVVYLTIGTGVGGGVLLRGRPLHRRLHRSLATCSCVGNPVNEFPGNCAFMVIVWRDLLSGPALRARFGVVPSDVPSDDPRWNRVISDLAEFLAIVIHSLAPNRILIGGGVGMGAPWIVDRIPSRLLPILGGYYPEVDECALATMITAPALGEAAGPLGAIAIGLAVLERSGEREERRCGAGLSAPRQPRVLTRRAARRFVRTTYPGIPLDYRPTPHTRSGHRDLPTTNRRRRESSPARA